MDPTERIQDMLNRNDTLAAETVEQIRHDMHTVTKVCSRCGKPLDNKPHATVLIMPQGRRAHYCHSDDQYPTCYMLAQWEEWPQARLNSMYHGND